ncbi:hypothetical protein ACIBJC_10640 [Streptomyces sp. NPDC050509]|uniref:hypothetical protein n=1 Tax=Streptomyces sp. NPDC050509 TaxID=3365620 RepID=UPI0037920589
MSCYPVSLPSAHHAPAQRQGLPSPPEGADNLALWDLDARGVSELSGDALNSTRLYDVEVRRLAVAARPLPAGGDMPPPA